MVVNDFVHALDVSSNQPSDLSAIINREKPDHGLEEATAYLLAVGPIPYSDER